MTRMGLTVNETKTKLREPTTERLYAKAMDPRVKPAGDDVGWSGRRTSSSRFAFRIRCRSKHNRGT
jgi:hypothetical protein